jgi:hypothetical protein
MEERTCMEVERVEKKKCRRKIECAGEVLKEERVDGGEMVEEEKVDGEEVPEEESVQERCWRKTKDGGEVMEEERVGEGKVPEEDKGWRRGDGGRESG